AQLGLLEAARERGLWVAVVDRDPAAAGFRFADRRCILSTEDEPAIERLISALEIDGIVAPGTDWPVGVAASVAELTGLPDAIERARSAARNALALVEELVDGPEVTVVGFSVDGDFTALAVTDRIVAEGPAFGVALAHVWPSHVQGQSLDVAARAVAALGIENGPSYTQLRLAPDAPRVIEVAARLGGGHDAELVETVTGIDLNGLTIDASLGHELV